MIDDKINKVLNPYLLKVAKILCKFRIKSNQVTFVGLILCFATFIALVNKNFNLCIIFFILNRICDGLDGSIARLTKPSDMGAIYDIVSDYILYGIIPLGFIIINNDQNGVAFGLLLFSFLGTCATFLLSAWFIEKNKINIKKISEKSFFYTRGITEGFETILFFLLMMIFPNQAYILAVIFSFLCWLTVLIRLRYLAFIIKNKKILIE